jgi:hypothetical protein
VAEQVLNDADVRTGPSLSSLFQADAARSEANPVRRDLKRAIKASLRPGGPCRIRSEQRGSGRKRNKKGEGKPYSVASCGRFGGYVVKYRKPSPKIKTESDKRRNFFYPPARAPHRHAAGIRSPP